jgi:CheY-like chemotaxis protein
VASHAPRDTDRDLAATLHEVGNALTVMLGWLEAADDEARAALETGAGADRALRGAAEALQVALSRARRAHRIARRAIALPTVGDDAPEAEPLGAVIEEARRGLVHEARRAGVALSCDVANGVAGAPIVSGERLLQVLTNLVLNAISVTPGGGAVSVQARIADDPTGPAAARVPCALVTVSDGGPGIPQPERARMFQRGATNRPGGAGIGLAHAQDVTAEEGGQLALAPFEQGAGARFELRWPLFDGAPITSPRTFRPVQLDGLAVVVLEDDAAIVELLDTMLSARGASVLAVKNVDALRAELAVRRADVALVDASPLGDGLESTLRSLQADFPATDLVLISGSPDPGVTAERLAVTWIRKPFEVNEVVEVLRVIRATSRSDK